MKCAKRVAGVWLIVALVMSLLPSLLVPTWMQDTLTPAVFEPFEASHPSVRVQLACTPGVPGFLNGADGVESYLDTVRQ